MENLLCIKGRVLGKEKPLVCVPIMATTKDEIIKDEIIQGGNREMRLPPCCFCIKFSR